MSALQIFYTSFDIAFLKLPTDLRTRIEARIDEMGTRLRTFPHHRLKGSNRCRLRVSDFCPLIPTSDLRPLPSPATPHPLPAMLRIAMQAGALLPLLGPLPNLKTVSLAEIEKAVDALAPEELAKLAAYISHHDNLVWDEQLERDFSPGGKHAAALQKIDAEIDAGNFTSLP